MYPIPVKLKPVSALLVASFALQLSASPAAAATRLWDGNGANNNWGYFTTIGGIFPGNTNWTDDSTSPLPFPGDSLVFRGISRLTNINDRIGLSINGITFETGAGAFTLNGNGITSTADITNGSANLQTLNLPITLGNSQTWDGGTAGMTFGSTVQLGTNALTINANGSGNVTLTEGINGSGDLVKTGDGGLILQGNSVNGVTTVNGGNLSLAGGSQLSSSVGRLGSQAGTSGTASVSGANSQWTMGNLEVGSDGNGTLNIQNGGKAITTQGTLGNNTTGNGTVTVDGTDSLWSNSGDLFVGRFGQGELNIQNGGKVVTGGFGVVGNPGTGTVTVKGTSSEWSLDKDLSIGSDGTGTLNIQNGSKVSNRNGLLGNGFNGNGIVTVDGANSLWSNSGDLIVGLFSQGELIIQNGGKVISNRGSLGYVGSQSNGTVTVKGANSEWKITSNLQVGDEGKGTLNIENGGAVTVGGDFTIGGHFNSTVNLNGGSLSAATTYLAPNGQFNWTAGTLNLSGSLAFGDGSGGILSGDTLLLNANQTLNIGGNANFTANSLLSVGGGLGVGGNLDSAGLLNIAAGRTATVGGVLTNSGNLVNRGTLQAGSVVNTGGIQLAGVGNIKATTLNLNGGSISGSPLLMDNIGTLTGHGTVAAAAGGGTAANTIQASGGNLTLGDANSNTGYQFGGKLDVGSGQITLHDKDKAELGISTSLAEGGKLSTINGADLGAGETLSFNGNASILGDFTNNGQVSGSAGTLAFLNNVNGAGGFSGDVAFKAGYNPGNSPAAVDFHGGNASFGVNSVLDMEIFGKSPGDQYDQLFNIGTLSFNGSLNLIFGNGYTPDAGDTFNLFNYALFEGVFDPLRINVSGFDRNRLDFTQLGQNGTLRVATAPVPLPPAVWLFGSALAGLMAFRTRPS